MNKRATATAPPRAAPPIPADTGSASDAPQRLPVVDLLRGLAIAQMVAYHFIYDLTYFGWLHFEMTEIAGWVAWRNAIVTQFLLVCGVGVGLGEAAGRTGARFWRRWLQIAGAAALVSIASAWLFGPRWIWFGMLHFVAVALLIARPLASVGGIKGGAVNLAVGAAVLVLGWTVHDERFDSQWIGWIGMAADRPPTEDYVPLVPWFGVVAIGIGLTAFWTRRGFATPPALRELDSPPARALRWLGRWPLTIYLVHQPIMMAVLMGVRHLAGD